MTLCESDALALTPDEIQQMWCRAEVARLRAGGECSAPSHPPPRQTVMPTVPISMLTRLQVTERNVIAEYLQRERTLGDVAHSLGLSRFSLNKKMRTYGLAKGRS